MGGEAAPTTFSTPGRYGGRGMCPRGLHRVGQAAARAACGSSSQGPGLEHLLVFVDSCLNHNTMHSGSNTALNYTTTDITP